MPRTAQEVWIDVRSVAEHEASSIPGHANIPHPDIGGSIGDLVTDKNAPVFLYCGSGRRAGIAKETLDSLGYTNVTNSGGIDDVRKGIQIQEQP